MSSNTNNTSGGNAPLALCGSNTSMCAQNHSSAKQSSNVAEKVSLLLARKSVIFTDDRVPVLAVDMPISYRTFYREMENIYQNSISEILTPYLHVLYVSRPFAVVLHTAHAGIFRHTSQHTERSTMTPHYQTKAGSSWPLSANPLWVKHRFYFCRAKKQLLPQLSLWLPQLLPWLSPPRHTG